MNFFEDLFMLELANNHLGDFERAKQMIKRCALALNNCNHKVKAAIKFQLRDPETFVHKDSRERQDLRYVRKVLDTVLTPDEYRILYDYARECGFLTAATPFDEAGVKMCADFNLDIIKLASSDTKDISLLKSIAMLNKPAIASLGALDIDEIDNLVSYFELLGIDFALNHCVSLYPSEIEDLNLEKISFLKNRYPLRVIGFSTHQKDNLKEALMCAYAYGARMIERHIDIEYKGVMSRPYCSKPEDLEEMADTYFLAKKMSASSPQRQILTLEKEKNVSKKFLRGIYAKRDLISGERLSSEDFYYAIPCLDNQMSHNNILEGKFLSTNVKKDSPIFYDFVKMKTEV